MAKEKSSSPIIWYAKNISNEKDKLEVLMNDTKYINSLSGMISYLVEEEFIKRKLKLELSDGNTKI